MWVAAALCTDKAGGYAVVYGGMGIPGKTPGLWLLDFDLGPLHGDIFADILARIQKLICACRAPNGTVFLPEDLRGHAEAAGLPCVSIPADFDVEQRLFSVGAHARAGNVKVCAPALAKAESSPFMGSLDLRAGEDVEVSAARRPHHNYWSGARRRKKDGCGMIVDLMGQKFEPEPEVITIRGGIGEDASGDVATYGDVTVERKPGESDRGFSATSAGSAQAAGVEWVVFGGLPKMNANGGDVNLKENEQ